MNTYDYLKYVVGYGYIVKYKNKESEFETKGLPEGWLQTSLSSISKINPKPRKNSIDGDLEVSFVPMKCVKELSGEINLSITKQYCEVKKGYTFFEDRDIVFAKITPCMENGKIAVMEGLKNGIGLGSTEFHVIRLHSSIPRGFYFYYFTQDEFRKKAQSKMKGTAGQLRVPTNFLQQEFVPVPPLAEQRRIVHKIESIFAQIDACKERLKRLTSQTSTASGSLAQLKNSVLKQAFEGKLTPQDLNDPSVRILLKKLSQNSGKKLEFKNENLPSNWIKIPINYVCVTKSGGTPSRKNPNYFNGNIPWIKSGELNDSVITECEEKITKLGLENSNATIYPVNTVLMAMYGATIGKLSILNFEASTNQAICAFFHDPEMLFNLYLFWFLMSIRTDLLKSGFGGAQKNLSQEKIHQIQIPLPPILEQHHIVSKIESIFAKIDAHTTHVLFA